MLGLWARPRSAPLQVIYSRKHVLSRTSTAGRLEIKIDHINEKKNVFLVTLCVLSVVLPFTQTDGPESGLVLK